MYQHQPQSTVYSSRRRPPKKKLRTLLIPIAVVLLVIFLVVNGVNMLFGGKKSPAEDTPLLQDYLASFTVEDGKVDVIFGQGDNATRHTVEEGNLIRLNTNEGIHTAANTRVTLKLVNNDIIRVDRDTTLYLEETRDNNVAIRLEEGSMWIVSDAQKTMFPTLLAELSYANVLLNRGSSASISKSDSEEYISVQKGSLQTEILGVDGEVIRTLPVGVGQEITLNKGLIESAKNDVTVDFVDAQSETFKETEWYKWNLGQDTSLSDYESAGDEDFNEADTDSEETTVATSTFAVTSHFDGKVVTEEYITLAGTYDTNTITAILIDGKEALLDKTTGKWKKNYRLTKNGDNDITITGTENGSRTTLGALTIVKDSDAPDAPKITSPTSSNTYSTSEKSFTLSGTTSADTSKIVVNGYTLQRFSPGDTRWTYNVSTDHGNLSSGNNTFEVYAVDKAGNKSASTTLTITYTAAAGEESTTSTETETTTEETDTDTEEEDTTTTTVSLTAPVVTFPVNASTTTTEPEVSIRGTVSSATARVTVNGYTLQQYQAGSTSFGYNAFVRLGTLRAGTNTYSVVAYDKNGKASAPTTITINYQPVQ